MISDTKKKSKLLASGDQLAGAAKSALQDRCAPPSCSPHPSCPAACTRVLGGAEEGHGRWWQFTQFTRPSQVSCTSVLRNPPHPPQPVADSASVSTVRSDEFHQLKASLEVPRPCGPPEAAATPVAYHADPGFAVLHCLCLCLSLPFLTFHCLCAQAGVKLNAADFLNKSRGECPRAGWSNPLP